MNVSKKPYVLNFIRFFSQKDRVVVIGTYKSRKTGRMGTVAGGDTHTERTETEDVGDGLNIRLTPPTAVVVSVFYI